MRVERHGELETCNLDAEFVAMPTWSEVSNARTYGGIDDAGSEKVLEMHLEAISAAAQSRKLWNQKSKVAQLPSAVHPTQSYLPWLPRLSCQVSWPGLVVCAPRLPGGREVD